MSAELQNAVPISISFPPGTVEQLDDIAASRQISRSEAVRMAVASFWKISDTPPDPPAPLKPAPGLEPGSPEWRKLKSATAKGRAEIKEFDAKGDDF